MKYLFKGMNRTSLIRTVKEYKIEEHAIIISTIRFSVNNDVNVIANDPVTKDTRRLRSATSSNITNCILGLILVMRYCFYV